MSVHKRVIASVPVRSASATWEFIVNLIASSSESSRSELLKLTGIAASVIIREAMKSSPIIIQGQGPRLRIYCIYGEDSIEGTKTNEALLADSPAQSGDEWSISLPCPTDDLTWVSASLSSLTSRVTVRDMAETDLPIKTDTTSYESATVNIKSFLQ